MLDRRKGDFQLQDNTRRRFDQITGGVDIFWREPRARLHPAEPLDVAGGAGRVPAHHRPGRDERDDPVDAELGQLLDDPLGALPLDGREGHRERGLGPGLELDGAVTADARPAPE